MSGLNIAGAIRNIGSGTTAYTPVVETVVNAIQAIREKDEENGRIRILVVRSQQRELDGKDLHRIQSFIIEDNGIGFNDKNRQSFDTIYSDYKLKEGGKGFGRFVCLRYFENLRIESIYEHEGILKERKFRMGRDDQIIVDEPIRKKSVVGSTRTSVRLENFIGEKFPDREIQKIAEMLLERLLSYFIDDKFLCPQISISEQDGKGEVVLNKFIDNRSSTSIETIDLDEDKFVLENNGDEQQFRIQLFKFYSPKQKKNMISLVAHGRQVTKIPIENYIPEFHEEFYGYIGNNLDSQGPRFVVRGYVFGDYLDDNVSLERGNFEFSKDQADLVQGISKKDIEKEAAKLSKMAVAEEIDARKKEKKKKVRSYVDEDAPWLKQASEKIDLDSLSCKATKDEIRSFLTKEDYRQEDNFKTKLKAMIKKDNINDMEEDVEDLTKYISLSSRDALTHYLTRRKYILEILNKRLECRSEEEEYPSEASLHNIIFPQGKDSDGVSYDAHNLWIIDERLNFTEYICSDKSVGNTRPDILAFPPPMIFSNGEEPSNPVILVEFKRPGRNDFTKRFYKEDPIDQISRYVSDMRKMETIKVEKGRQFSVNPNTPFYGYLVCTVDDKVMEWLKLKEFRAMADSENWFQWFANKRLYFEVISWDKLLKNAEIRHSAFFKKLKFHAGLRSR